MNKKAVFCIVLSGSLLLNGCSSMLQRSYTSITPHSAAPTVESDQLTIRVESYQDLVNALLYFVTQGKEQGTIRLYNYPYDVEEDMDAACTEVITEDPLGAYAVKKIDFSITPIVSCYEADVSLTYRRTREQISAITSTVGVTATRSALRKALSTFREETALRVSYFEGDEATFLELLEEAYFSAPETALGMPEVTFSLYPEDGLHRILEVKLAFSLPATELQAQSVLVLRMRDHLLNTLPTQQGDAAILAIYDTLTKKIQYDPAASSSTYDALSKGQADSQGLALTAALLCQKLEIPCLIVKGSRNDLPHYWNIVSTQEGYRHLDLSFPSATGESPLHFDQTMYDNGFRWDTVAFPQCAAPPES